MTKNELPTCSCGNLASFTAPAIECIECHLDNPKVKRAALRAERQQRWETARIARAEQKMGR